MTRNDIEARSVLLYMYLTIIEERMKQAAEDLSKRMEAGLVDELSEKISRILKVDDYNGEANQISYCGDCDQAIQWTNDKDASDSQSKVTVDSLRDTLTNLHITCNGGMRIKSGGKTVHEEDIVVDFDTHTVQIG